jgi:hypothetical protein
MENEAVMAWGEPGGGAICPTSSFQLTDFRGNAHKELSGFSLSKNFSNFV